jgi:hypothetical protein
MILLAAVRELKSINQHKTGSEDSYKQAIQFQLLNKNFICGKHRGEILEKILSSNNWIYNNSLFSLISMLNYTEHFFILNSCRFRRKAILFTP